MGDYFSSYMYESTFSDTVFCISKATLSSNLSPLLMNKHCCCLPTTLLTHTLFLLHTCVSRQAHNLLFSAGSGAIITAH